MLLLDRPCWLARRVAAALIAAPLLLTLLAGAPSVSAAGLCVNPHGTDGCYSSINAAIAAATPGATITVHSGDYVENVIITKPLTLQGDGNPTIYSAVSNPTCSDPTDSSGTLCAPNSTIVLVQANNVTIAGLTLDGDNPHLHSGVELGGADVDARNGIVTDFNTVASVQNLVVRDTTVRNVDHRGIQITSDSGVGTFTFQHNTVHNVQGNPNYSVAMLSNGNYGGSGTMSDNTVSDASDALNSNWSHGITFSDNTVVRSGSGIHSDNAGGAGGGTPDLMVDNTVSNCTPGGLGIWTFVSYIAPTVLGNTVSNCDTGLAVYGIGGAAGSVTPLFEGNTVRSNGGPNTIGALVTTDLSVIYAPGVYYNASALFSGNVIRGAATGERVVQNGGKTADVTFSDEVVRQNSTGLDADGATVTMVNSCVAQNQTGLLAHDGATLTARGNAVQGNTSYGAQNGNAGATPSIDATANWWGSASGPAPSGHGDRISAGVNATPFLSDNPNLCGSDGGDGGRGNSSSGGGDR